VVAVRTAVRSEGMLLLGLIIIMVDGF